MSETIDQVQVSIPSISNEHVTSARSFLELAQTYAIDCPQMAEMANEDLKKIKLKYKQIDEVRKSLVQPIDQARRRIQDFFRHPLEWLEQAEAALKASLGKFQDAEEAKRREEESIKRKAAEEIAARMREEAAVLAKQGDVETARALNLQAAMLPALVQADTPVTVLAGVSSREVWNIEIIDATIIPREYLEIDYIKIRKVVAALKGETNIPGVRVFSQRQLSVKAG